MFSSLQRFDESNVVFVMKQVLSAVKYCHKKRIVHRDLKPENILFIEKDIKSAVKIIDFGRSKILKFDKKINEIAGSVIFNLY